MIFVGLSHHKSWLPTSRSSTSTPWTGQHDFNITMVININAIMVIKFINTMYNMIRRLEATKEHNNIEKIKSWHFEFRQVPQVGKHYVINLPTCAYFHPSLDARRKKTFLDKLNSLLHSQHPRDRVKTLKERLIRENFTIFHHHFAR